MIKRRKVKVKKRNRYKRTWNTISKRFTETPRLKPEDAITKANNQPDDPHHLAEQVLSSSYKHKDSFTLRYYQGAWYHWRDTHYNLLASKEFRANINKGLRQVFDNTASDHKVIRQVVENVTLAIEGMCLVSGHLEIPLWLGESTAHDGSELLSMNNGLLDLEAALTEDEATLHEPSPDWFCLSHWDYDYDPTAKCRKWNRFLKEVLPNLKERRLLQEFLGYCLTFDTSFHKAIILVGEGANGKSVVTEVATQLIGPDNVTHLGLERFGERFSLATTIGRLANIASEITRTKGVAEGILKAMVSGDLIRIERKYQEPADARPTARLIFATNEIPNFVDRSEGLWRRLLFLPFNVTIPEDEQDRSLARRICKTELPGIFNWAIRGLKRLRKNDSFTVPLSSKRLLKEQKNASNPARQFLTERYEHNKDEKVQCEEVYQKYTMWCHDQSISPLTKQQLGKEVFRVFPEVKRSQRRFSKHKKGARLYYYVGLGRQG